MSEEQKKSALAIVGANTSVVMTAQFSADSMSVLGVEAFVETLELAIKECEAQLRENNATLTSKGQLIEDKSRAQGMAECNLDLSKAIAAGNAIIEAGLVEVTNEAVCEVTQDGGFGTDPDGKWFVNCTTRVIIKDKYNKNESKTVLSRQISKPANGEINKLIEECNAISLDSRSIEQKTTSIKRQLMQRDVYERKAKSELLKKMYEGSPEAETLKTFCEGMQEQARKIISQMVK